MKKKLLVLAGAMLLVLSACTPGKPAATPTQRPSAPESTAPSAPAEPTPSAPAAEKPAEAPIWGKKTWTCAENDATDTDVQLVWGEFVLPYIENAEGTAAYEAINEYYLDLSAGLRSDTLMNADQAAADYALSKSMGYPFSAYSDEESFEITRCTARMVSILRTHYGYTGGVYPTLLYLSDHFDLTTGKKLTFADFFSDPDAAESRAREVLRTAAAGADEEEKLRLETLLERFKRENFYLTEDEVVFFTQPDPDTPHAAGAVTGSVSRETLADLLADWG